MITCLDYKPKKKKKSRVLFWQGVGKGCQGNLASITLFGGENYFKSVLLQKNFIFLETNQIILLPCIYYGLAKFPHNFKPGHNKCKEAR